MKRRPCRRPTLLALVLVTSVVSCAAASWVTKSNENAQVLLEAIGRTNPEQASGWGLTAYDALTLDPGPGIPERQRAATAAAKAELDGRFHRETVAPVKQDLGIMIHAAELRLEGIDLDQRYQLPYVDAAELIFQGEFTLLNPEASPERHPAAVQRLKRYAGQVNGVPPFTALARARTEQALANSHLLGPFRGELEQSLANAPRYLAGLQQLFAKYHLDAGDTLAVLEKQLADYAAWTREKVLPRARDDFHLPPELYAYQLRTIGLEISPDQLIDRAELEYANVTAELRSLAPLVAREHGWPETDYRAVIHRLKQQQLRRDQVEAYYQQTVIPRLEEVIRKERIVTLSAHPMVMRLASEAESAAQPAPHLQLPPLINNHGQRGTFVLTAGNPASNGAADDAYDDFTFPAVAWSLTAHEGRPGHELQFARMVEGGVSYARAIFAFNSVNAEGWALYCETEMKPYEPLDAQLMTLQFRLLRAVRAFADPMLNLGRITPERVQQILVQDVCLSTAFAREEVDRFTFRMPGQATAYFYGFSRLMALKAATEVALGPKFDRMAFNDFIIDQGLLPPAALAEAVRTQFIPAQQAGAEK